MHNVRYLGPGKSWRPIITLEIDEHPSHEVVLGTDGQNPNLKQPVLLDGAYHGSQLGIKVWHKSQSKSKRKRRHLVASTGMVLGEVVKKQGDDSHVEIQLSCASFQGRKSAAHKQQHFASLIVRVRQPPPPPSSSSSTALASEVEDGIDGDRDDDDACSGTSSQKSLGSTLITSVAEGKNPLPWEDKEPPTKLRRRRVRPRPYCLDSDAQPESDYTSEDESIDLTPEIEDPWPAEIIEEKGFDDGDVECIRICSGSPEPLLFFAPSLLPLRNYADNVSVASSVSLATSIFDTFSYYRELREARVDSEYEAILNKLMLEWRNIGGLLLAVAALDTAVFGFSPGTLFGVDTFAKRAVTISSIASGIGLATDAWFIFAYSGADVRKFQTLAVDLYSSFFFFSLTSRMPLLAFLLSVISLVLFLFAIAWVAWPTAVIVTSFLSGLLLSLQFIIYGFHKGALALIWAVKYAWRGIKWGWRKVIDRGGGATAEQPPIPLEEKVPVPC
ncbi:hypothetical protein EW146_g8347 [Bondarzewia mesenterica]|uniref:Uncharacterized protein n=1 Tax=Bondarzewia mesenterica TaxID=1095465 RepID=A0A4S4LGY7_9AGAM|nr:hypothetical protein EW146_g8347 [Bondarzewia mesenterica]